MNLSDSHFEEAQLRFSWAHRALEEEKFGLAAHLFINAAIKFSDFLCQKHLHEVFSRKHHSDLRFIENLEPHLKGDFGAFRDAYHFLMDKKNQADYGTGISENIAKQVFRRAGKIREIAERHYS